MAIKYNTEKLKNDISIQTACDIAGIPVSRTGFIRCPEHLKRLGKMDNKCTNCKIYAHTYVCYACGGKGDIFSLIKGYKESYEGESLSFSDVAKILANGSGNERDYIISTSGKDEKISDPFPVSDSVLSFCELLPKAVQVKVPKMMGRERKDIPKNLEAVTEFFEDPAKSDSFDTTYVGYAFVGSYGIKNLYRDDPDSFWAIVYPKLCFGLDKLKECKGLFNSTEYRELLSGISGGIKIYNKKYGIADKKAEKEQKKQLLNSLF